MTEHDRKDDYSIKVLSQKFEDFVERYDRNQTEAKEWRFAIEERLKPLENIKTPFHMISVVVVLLLSGILFEIGRIVVSAVKLVNKG